MPPKYKPKAPPRSRKQAGDDTAQPRADDLVAAAASLGPDLIDPTTLPPPPIKRLESLSRPSGPAASTVTKPPLKFKPKSIIRRSKDERERAEREEQERIASRSVAGSSGLDAGSGRGRGRGDFRGGMRGRGRGGVGINWNDRFHGATASGPFAAGSNVTVSKKYPTEGGRSGYGGSSSSVSSRSNAKVKDGRDAAPASDIPIVDQDGDVVMDSRPQIKRDPYLSSSDDEDSKEGVRVNIEHINLISDDEDDPPSVRANSTGRRPSSGRRASLGLRPVRIDRTEHVERSKGISTEANLRPANDARRLLRKITDSRVLLDSDSEWKGRRGRERTKDVELIKTERKWRGVYDDDDYDGIHVKPEPLDGTDAMDLDPSPNINKGKERQSRQSVSPTARAKHPIKHKRIKKRVTPFKPVILSAEDQKEWERHEQDLQYLVEELGMMKPEEQPKPDVNADGDVAIDAPLVTRDAKEGCLYLFQFPPVMPPLVSVTDPGPLIIAKVDPDGVVESGADATTDLALEAIVGATREGSTEGDGLEIIEDGSKYDPTTTREALPPQGRVGKLRLHRSGRVTMQWGGLGGPKLELMKGGNSEFLTDVLATKAKGVDGHEENVAFGMGPVKDKFIVIPDWKNLLGR